MSTREIVAMDEGPKEWDGRTEFLLLARAGTHGSTRLFGDVKLYSRKQENTITTEEPMTELSC